MFTRYVNVKRKGRGKLEEFGLLLQQLPNACFRTPVRVPIHSKCAKYTKIIRNCTVNGKKMDNQTDCSFAYPNETQSKCIVLRK